MEKIPEARRGDISRQLPTLQADLNGAEQELMRDDCTIMIAGEWFTKPIIGVYKLKSQDKMARFSMHMKKMTENIHIA